MPRCVGNVFMECIVFWVVLCLILDCTSPLLSPPFIGAHAFADFPVSGKNEQNSYIYGNSEHVKELSASHKEELLQLTADMSLSDVTRVNNPQFLKSGVPTIVVFYAPWCPHCRRYKDSYEELSTKFYGIFGNSHQNIQFASVNCVDENELCKLIKLCDRSVRSASISTLKQLKQRENSGGLIKSVGKILGYGSEDPSESDYSYYTDDMCGYPSVVAFNFELDKLSMKADTSEAVARKSIYTTPADRLHDALTSLNYMLRNIASEAKVSILSAEARETNDDSVDYKTVIESVDRFLDTIVLLLPHYYRRAYIDVRAWLRPVLVLLQKPSSNGRKLLYDVMLQMHGVNSLQKLFPEGFHSAQTADAQAIEQAYSHLWKEKMNALLPPNEGWRRCGLIPSKVMAKTKKFHEMPSNPNLVEVHSVNDGYTCGLWLLFHYMTVASEMVSLDPTLQIADMSINTELFSFRGSGQKQQNPDEGGFVSRDLPAVLPVNVMRAIRMFVDNLFGCSMCRSHFLKGYDQCLFMRCAIGEPRSNNVAMEASGDLKWQGNEYTILQLWLNQFHNSVAVRLLRFYGKAAFAQTAQGAIDLDDYYESIVFPQRKQCPNCYNQQKFRPDNGTQPMPAAYSIENVNVDHVKKMLIATYWSGQFRSTDDALSFRKFNFNVSELPPIVLMDVPSDESKASLKTMFIEKYKTAEDVEGQEGYLDSILSAGLLTIISLLSIVLLALVALYSSLHRRTKAYNTSTSTTTVCSSGLESVNRPGSRRRKYSNGFQNQKENSPYVVPSKANTLTMSGLYSAKSESDDE